MSLLSSILLVVIFCIIIDSQRVNIWNSSFLDETNGGISTNWIIEGGSTSFVTSQSLCPSTQSMCIEYTSKAEIYRYYPTFGYESIQLSYSIRTQSLISQDKEFCEVWYILSQQSNDWVDWILISSDYYQTQSMNITIDFDNLSINASNRNILGIDFYAQTRNGKCYLNYVQLSGIPLRVNPTSDPTYDPTYDPTNGIEVENVLTITFTICNVSTELLTQQRVAQTETEYTNDFAFLFQVNTTQVNVTIVVGVFCDDNNNNNDNDNNINDNIPQNDNMNANANANDQEVTIVIIFTEAVTSNAASINICDEIEDEINQDIENCATVISQQDIGDDDDSGDITRDTYFYENPNLLIIIICSIVFVLIIICIIYLYLSYQKKKRKAELARRYRKRTVSGGDKRSSVVSGGANKKKKTKTKTRTGEGEKSKQAHTQQTSIPNIEQIEMAIKQTGIEGHYSNQSQEMEIKISNLSNLSNDISNISITSLNDMKDGGSPYTLLESYEDSFNIGNTKKYKSEREMIKHVIQNNKANEIKTKDLIILHQIGKGQFGAVFKAKWEGNVVVVKQLNSMNDNINVMNNTTIKLTYALNEGEYENTIVEENKNNMNNNNENYEADNINHDQIHTKKIKIKAKKRKRAMSCITTTDINTKKEQIAIANDKLKKKEVRFKEMKAEIILASSLPTHNNIVEIFGYTTSPFGVVMNYMCGGSVEKYVYRKYKSNPLRDPIPTIMELLIILQKAAAGIKYLHSFCLIHRDIACRNILLGKINNNKIDINTEVRISDFGLTRQLQYKNNNNNNNNNKIKGRRKSSISQKTKSNFGPLKWMAPESIKLKQYSKASDAYMFGITMWEIFYGMEPYINMLPIQIATLIVVKSIRPPILYDKQKFNYTEMPELYKELMEDCWNQKVTKRPTFEHIISVLTQIQSNLV